ERAPLRRFWWSFGEEPQRFRGGFFRALGGANRSGVQKGPVGISRENRPEMPGTLGWMGEFGLKFVVGMQHCGRTSS
ncbi:MAG TPA: hypothetical protein DCR50_11130, partial [Afipia sp.]|nr:hypothetical protein [Afipia sp.]